MDGPRRWKPRSPVRSRTRTRWAQRHRQRPKPSRRSWGYGSLFEQAFGDPQISFDRITKAIASLERTIVSGNSPYDRFLNGDKQALSPEAKRGLHFFERWG